MYGRGTLGLLLAVGALACARDPGDDAKTTAAPSATHSAVDSQPAENSQPTAHTPSAATGAAQGSGMLPAPIRPKSIVSRSIPPPGARVVMCIQQTATTGERAPSDCRAHIAATGGKQGVTGASLHAMVVTYIGGEAYGTLYAREVSAGADLTKLTRGPLVARDATGYGQLVVKDESGNYLLFFELERH